MKRLAGTVVLIVFLFSFPARAQSCKKQTIAQLANALAEAKALLRCSKGVCTFDFAGGIVHNILYLKSFTYGFRNGCPYIKTILLLDGD